MSQTLFADDLDDLVVQVAAELNLHSLSRCQPQHFRELLGIASDNWSNFLQSSISLSLFCAEAISCGDVFYVFFANAWKIKTESASFV